MTTKERSTRVLASAALALGIAVPSYTQQVNDSSFRQIQFSSAQAMLFEKKVDLECIQIILAAMKIYAASLAKEKNGAAHFIEKTGGTLKLDIYRNPLERPNHFFNARTGALEEVTYTVDISGNMKTDGKNTNLNRSYAIVVDNAASESWKLIYYSYVENRQLNDSRVPKMLDAIAAKVLNFGSTAPQIYQNGILLGGNGIVAVRFKTDDFGGKFIALDYYASISKFMLKKDPELSKDYIINKQQEGRPATAIKAALRH